jgi:hypothetical protein
MKTAGEVPMMGLTPYELKKRCENISPFQPIEVPDEAAFSHLFEFASSITFGEPGSFGGLATFFRPPGGRENRAVTEGRSLHSLRGGFRALDFTKTGQEPELICKI